MSPSGGELNLVIQHRQDWYLFGSRGTPSEWPLKRVTARFSPSGTQEHARQGKWRKQLISLPVSLVSNLLLQLTVFTIHFIYTHIHIRTQTYTLSYTYKHARMHVHPHYVLVHSNTHSHTHIVRTMCYFCLLPVASICLRHQGGSRSSVKSTLQQAWSSWQTYGVTEGQWLFSTS